MPYMLRDQLWRDFRGAPMAAVWVWMIWVAASVITELCFAFYSSYYDWIWVVAVSFGVNGYYLAAKIPTPNRAFTRLHLDEDEIVVWIEPGMLKRFWSGKACRPRLFAWREVTEVSQTEWELVLWVGQNRIALPLDEVVEAGIFAEVIGKVIHQISVVLWQKINTHCAKSIHRVETVQPNRLVWWLGPLCLATLLSTGVIGGLSLVLFLVLLNLLDRWFGRRWNIELGPNAFFGGGGTCLDFILWKELRVSPAEAGLLVSSREHTFVVNNQVHNYWALVGVVQAMAMLAREKEDSVSGGVPSFSVKRGSGAFPVIRIVYDPPPTPEESLPRGKRR